MRETKQRESSMNWFFNYMAALFPKQWSELYKKKRTVAMRDGKRIWAREMGEYANDHALVKRVAENARRKTGHPPSAPEFGALLRQEAMREKQANLKPPSDRALGKSALANIHATLGE